jgi:hypothetical protein
MSSLTIVKSDIIFHDKLSAMPISLLKTEITDDIIKSYGLAVLNIENVLNHIHEGHVYRNFVMDDKMIELIELIEFVERGNQLIPPIIRNIFNDEWKIFDGQHRVALSLKLEITSIPFLIRLDQMKYLNQLK